MKKIILDGIYEVGGGLGSWAKSKEFVPRGTVRYIGCVLMYAYTVYGKPIPFYYKETNWVPVEDSYNSSEALRDWLKNL